MAILKRSQPKRLKGRTHEAVIVALRAPAFKV
jgi:hypothetical protein